MLGLFINTIPVRVRVADNGSLLSLLRNIQQQQVEASEFEYAQLAETQKLSGLRNRGSLFDSLLLFQNDPYRSGLTLSPSGSRTRVENLEFSEHTNYPVTVCAWLDERLQIEVRLRASCCYAALAPSKYGAIEANPREHI